MERVLPAGHYRDIRWFDDRSVVLAAGKEGLERVILEPVAAPLETLVPGGEGPGTFWLPTRLAASDRFLAVAAPFFQFAWMDRQSGALTPPKYLEAILDLDLLGDTLLVLGAEKVADRMVPDGAIAWRGSLANGFADRKPVHFSKDGPGAPRINCAPVDLGAVRFLADGSFVVVPGVEPGVFWYEPDGRLRRTWQTEDLGIDDACPDDEARRDEIAGYPGPRIAWLNRHRIVDEILALPGGPALVVRDPQSTGETSWRLLLLGRDGSVKTWTVPIRGTAPLAHLSGDVRGDRIAFLVIEYGGDFALNAPQLPRRLVLTGLPK